MRVLCARELQVSIADSVHRLLSDQISALELDKCFKITQTGISCRNGSEFIFKGLRHNANEIKSLEGIDICWVEEAQKVSKESWDLLIPTIRKQGSEIWLSFNPDSPDDETWRRFVLSPPDDAIIRKVNYSDNPFFPDTLEQERAYAERVLNYDDYAHIWLGEPSIISDAQIFKNRWVVEEFTAPPKTRFYWGCDWGFATDPNTLIRCFITDNKLYIDYEAYGVGVELDEIPQLFDTIPESRKWQIKADCARPETISHIRNKGFNIVPAPKWQGSIEDGIAILKSFEKIVIHPRCKHTIEEMRMYSYKVDRITGEVLPIIVDAFNHCVDATRYALSDYIRNKASLQINRNIGRRIAAQNWLQDPLHPHKAVFSGIA